MSEREHVDPIERRLREWGWWLSNGISAGFPTKNILHESWLPPAPGSRPAMKISAQSDAEQRATHRAIERLSLRTANTLVVVYVMRLPPREQVQRLGCGESTVRVRVMQAKRRLDAAFRVD